MKKYAILKKGQYIQDHGYAYYLKGEGVSLKDALAIYAREAQGIYQTDLILVKIIDTVNDLEIKEK